MIICLHEATREVIDSKRRHCFAMEGKEGREGEMQEQDRAKEPSAESRRQMLDRELEKEVSAERRNQTHDQE